MLNLFKIEWMKVKSYRAFWILLGGFIVLFPLCFYFSSRIFLSNTGSREEDMLKGLLGNPYFFPKVWLTSSWFGGLFFIMIGMLFILLITNEVQYRTHRQNIIDGWSRFDFLKAKFSMLIFLVLIATAVVYICGLAMGSYYSPAALSKTTGLYYIAYFALMATMYLVVAFLIAILVKRTGLSIIIYFAFICIVDNLLWAFFFSRNSQLAYFWPLESTDSLLPNPYKPSLMERRTSSDTSLIIAAFAYLVLFGFIIKNYFQKTDLKT